jgi:apolipoprotein N-acyltransferase
MDMQEDNVKTAAGPAATNSGVLASRPALADRKWIGVFCAVLTGLLVTAIFPRLELPWLAWICLLPVLLLVPYSGPARLFRLFWLAGAIFSAGNLYWIVHVIEHYTAVGMLASTGVVALLCLAMGLFWGGFGALTGFLVRRLGSGPALVLAPFVWLLAEYGRNIVHFPWCLLGYSQYASLRLAQAASLAGVYGLSWLIVAVNAGLAAAILLRRYVYIITSLALITLVSIYGNVRIARPVDGQPLTIGVVQPDIPQDEKINAAYADTVNRLHMQMTRRLVGERRPDMVFWSESSTLYPLKLGGVWTDQVLQLARETRTPIVVGSDGYVDDRVYNSVYLITASGRIDPRTYSKMYLVPFGEYVPFTSMLFFAGKVVPEISDFSPGTDYTLFPVGDGSFAVNVCFEVVFPQLSRRFVREGASMLSTITNDAWFGRTAAPYQHFAMAVMRSIETRRYLVRAANTGISGFVDPYGRILRRSDIFVRETMAAQVRLVNEQTFYTRHGDWLLALSALVTLAAVLRAVFIRSAGASVPTTDPARKIQNRKV